MSNPALTSVGTRPAAAYAGQDEGDDGITDSYVNESATAIDAGVPVVRGTATTTTGTAIETCKPMAADTDEILGVSLRIPLKDADSTQDPKFARYEMVPVKRFGRVAVIAAEDVRGGDEVIVVTSGAQVKTTAFASSKGGVAGSGRVAMTGWKWCGNGVITSGSVGFIESFGNSRGRTTT